MTYFAKQLTAIENRIDDHECIEPNISSSSVGWHLEHILIAFNQIIIELQETKTETYKWRFNKYRLFVFLFNFIPRGKGKAPKAGLPKAYNKERLLEHLQTTKMNINKLNQLDPNLFFIHPKFGSLKLKQTKQFLKIHTNHHLKIIEDIINYKSH